MTMAKSLHCLSTEAASTMRPQVIALRPLWLVQFAAIDDFIEWSISAIISGTLFCGFVLNVNKVCCQMFCISISWAEVDAVTEGTGHHEVASGQSWNSPGVYLIEKLCINDHSFKLNKRGFVVPSKLHPRIFSPKAYGNSSGNL